MNVPLVWIRERTDEGECVLETRMDRMLPGTPVLGSLLYLVPGAQSPILRGEPLVDSIPTGSCSSLESHGGEGGC